MPLLFIWRRHRRCRRHNCATASSWANHARAAHTGAGQVRAYGLLLGLPSMLAARLRAGKDRCQVLLLQLLLLQLLLLLIKQAWRRRLLRLLLLLLLLSGWLSLLSGREKQIVLQIHVVRLSCARPCWCRRLACCRLACCCLACCCFACWRRWRRRWHG